MHRRRQRGTSGGLGPTLRRQVDPRQRTPPAARVASDSGHKQPPALQKRLGQSISVRSPPPPFATSGHGQNLDGDGTKGQDTPDIPADFPNAAAEEERVHG